MSIKIAVVDDEKESADALEEYIRRYGRENGESFDITWFRDGIDIASDYKPLFSIIFLDIQMKGLNGMAAAEKIRRFDPQVILIFVTNMAQYAIKGYSVGALDFLLKPVPYFAFSQLFQRSVDRVKRSRDNFLLVPSDNGLIKVDVSEIIFIEILNRKIIVHTERKEYGLPATMKELEERLGGCGFFRCNYCYIVNLAYVREVSGCIVKAGGGGGVYDLAISRPRKKAFMEALTDHVGGVVKRGR
jgi:DNA-binding LytR/AlgR family response regulator